jgi:hypothetical protein
VGYGAAQQSFGASRGNHADHWCDIYRYPLSLSPRTGAQQHAEQVGPVDVERPVKVFPTL